MGVKGIGQSRRIYRLQDYAAVVLVIIIKAAEKDERRTDIDMIGEEAAGDAQLSHSRSDDPYKGSPDLWLDITMVPGVAGKDFWSRATSWKKEEVRVAEEGERRRAVGIGKAIHVKQLLSDRIDQRPLQLRT
jgi:hypothetical protein